MSAISDVRARRILDSRGRPTVEVDVVLVGGARGRAAVPSGASTGRAEAHELRDGDPAHFGGLDVSRAVANVVDEIAPVLRGRRADDQRELDELLRALDGTPDLARLGANAVLGVSLAAARAAALAADRPLFAHLARLGREAGLEREPSMPVPMVNIFSGGLHARAAMDVQDVLAIPLGADDYPGALEIAWRVRAAAADVLERRGLSTLLADEGGLSPAFARTETALDAMLEAFDAAGLVPGRDVAIALDMAATGLWDERTERYRFARSGETLTAAEVGDALAAWMSAYPLISVEDALHDEDWDGWRMLTARLGQLQLVGDDLFATSAARIARGSSLGAANCALIKVNQNGTLTGTFEAIGAARRAGFETIVSARSGETEDSFIADLAVGLGAGQIKIGSLRTSERLCKYNALTRLSEDVGRPLGPVIARLRAIARSGAPAR